MGIVALSPAAHTLAHTSAPATGVPLAEFAVYSPWTAPVLAGTTGALLRAARRPTAEMYAVAALAVVAAGAPLLGWAALAWAPTVAGLTWLFGRTRRLSPLLAAATLPAAAALTF